MPRLVIALACICLVGIVATPVASASDDGTRTGASLPWAEPAAPPWPATDLDAEGNIGLAAGHGRFVVVGSRWDPGPKAGSWISTDGRTWIKGPSDPDLKRKVMGEVVAVPNGFVAFGTTARGVRRDYHRGRRILAWVSPDGAAWRRAAVKRGRSPHRFLDAGIAEVVAGPAGLVALGGFSGQDHGIYRLWRSRDGAAWRRGRLPAVDIVNDIAATRTHYLVSGYTHRRNPSLSRPGDPAGRWSLWRSEDARSWQLVQGTPAPLVRLAASEAGVVVGTDGRSIFATRDLETWEPVWENLDPDADDANFGVVWWDGEHFVATDFVLGYQACADGAGWCPLTPVLFSSDGHAWSVSAGPDGRPGPDPDTGVIDTAVLDGRKVALGYRPGSGAVAWLVGEVPTVRRPDGHTGSVRSAVED